MTVKQVAQRTREGPPWTLRRVPDDFDVVEYAEFDLRPLSPTIGAEITGIRLSDELTGPARTELRRALLEWKVLFFPEQPMNELEFLAFGRTWGTVMIPAMTKNREIPEVQELTNALLHTKTHRPPKKRAVLPEYRRRLRRVRQQFVAELPVDLEVGCSAQQVVVHPSGIRPVEIDIRRHPVR